MVERGDGIVVSKGSVLVDLLEEVKWQDFIEGWDVATLTGEGRVLGNLITIKLLECDLNFGLK